FLHQKVFFALYLSVSNLAKIHSSEAGGSSSSYARGKVGSSCAHSSARAASACHTAIASDNEKASVAGMASAHTSSASPSNSGQDARTGTHASAS
ncbi:MAG TPA: hypothetical protein VFV38_13305, partial [Ktedonobacteraceae bacterium]|nr:hypothetical protein [Ktedonobacteraceae bacterium]